GRRAGRIGLAADGSVCRWQATSPASGPLRLGRPDASLAQRAALRRRAHGVVPVLLAARGECGQEARRIPRPGRLARDLDAWLLAELRRPAGGLDRLERASRLRACPAARVLLLEAAREAPEGSGLHRKAHPSRGSIRGTASASGATTGTPGGGLCRP